MRIALVIGDYNSQGGGAERWTDRFARWLLSKGHEVHLIARRFTGAPEQAVCLRVSVGDAWKPHRRLRFAEEVEKVVRAGRYDVVHDMGDGWAADVFMPHHGTRAAGFRRNSSLLPQPLRWSRTLLYNWLPRYREFQSLERRQYVQDGKVFVALSKMVRDHMREYFGIDGSNIEVVYNGVDVDHFTTAFDADFRDLTRRELGFTTETVFLIVAHNFRLKGLATLLGALSRIRRSSPVGLVVAGNGRIREFRRIAESRGVADLVRFIGNLSDPRSIYQASDVYVQPTFYDPCSLVVLEAMACGLPVITTSYNGVSEIMTSGREGFVLEDPRDEEGLAAQMEQLTDLALRVSAARSARALAEQHSLERNCEQILALYQRVHQSKQAA